MQRSRERGESVMVGDRERLRACGMSQKKREKEKKRTDK